MNLESDIRPRDEHCEYLLLKLKSFPIQATECWAVLDDGWGDALLQVQLPGCFKHVQTFEKLLTPLEGEREGFIGPLAESREILARLEKKPGYIAAQAFQAGTSAIQRALSPQEGDAEENVEETLRRIALQSQAILDLPLYLPLNVGKNRLDPAKEAELRSWVDQVTAGFASQVIWLEGVQDSTCVSALILSATLLCPAMSHDCRHALPNAFISALGRDTRFAECLPHLNAVANSEVVISAVWRRIMALS